MRATIVCDMLNLSRSRLLVALVVSALLLGAGHAPHTSAQAGVRIFEIQGAAHVSPLVGQRVAEVPGIVTALRSNGFYLQDAEGDGRAETSDAVFVFTRDDPAATVGVAPGDSVRVSGQVHEFRPAGDETNLSITEIVQPAVAVVAPGQPLPPPVLLGPPDRAVPSRIVAEGFSGDVESLPALRPDERALDFFESLESMRVQIDDAVAIGQRTGPGELPVLPGNGVDVPRRTVRGGLLPPAPGEASPRIILTDGTLRVPPTSVADRFPGPTVGIVDYAFGGYRVRVSELPPMILGGLEPETADPAPEHTLSVATFNLENLSARESPAKLARLAETIVARLHGPDLLVLQEIQDNSGAGDNGIVAADRSARALIEAIAAAGGPTYEYREIAPENNQDGGEPGANIRVGFLFQTDRGLSFVERAGGDAVTPVAIVVEEDGVRLSASPGRIEPASPAWLESRKPLVGEFTFNGQRLFVVGCHFNSKRGDQPLFGRFQPPDRPSEAQRIEQARLVHAFARDVLAADPNARLIVLGDLNDVPGSATLEALKGSLPEPGAGEGTGLLTSLVETLSEAEQYSFVFGGQSEAIDHILVSPGLLGIPWEVDIVHGNAEIVGAPTDHDPVLARFTLPPR